MLGFSVGGVITHAMKYDSRIAQTLGLFPIAQQVVGFGGMGYHTYKAGQLVKAVANFAREAFKGFSLLPSTPSKIEIHDAEQENQPQEAKNFKGRWKNFVETSKESRDKLVKHLKLIGINVIRATPVVGTIHSIHALYGKKIQAYTSALAQKAYVSFFI